MIRLSVVIPAYREAENIEEFVSQFLETLPDAVREALFEVNLVENGGDQPTLDACARLAARYPDLVRVFSNSRASYGEAIKRGMLESRGTHVAILECDFLYADYVAASLAVFQESDCRFTVASKQHPQSVDQRPFKRRMLTLGFNLILNTLMGYPGTDTHGLKCIETELAKKLCSLAQTTDEVFQTEIVLIAWKLGEVIRELPMHISERRPTRVSVTKRLPKVWHIVKELRASLERFA